MQKHAFHFQFEQEVVETQQSIVLRSMVAEGSHTQDLWKFFMESMSEFLELFSSFRRKLGVKIDQLGIPWLLCVGRRVNDIQREASRCSLEAIALSSPPTLESHSY